jgi:16S rRNA (guanine966-N2)-methyltransferase
VRIVGGSHRGRRLSAPVGRAVRPTSDRAREALFNILAHSSLASGSGSLVAGARVLDAFCGTGALGLEALSRGAAHVTFLDCAAPAMDAVRRNAAALGETARTCLLRADATCPPLADQACTLAFLDPPYGCGLASPALAALVAARWLASGALVITEVGASEPLVAPASFRQLEERRYGRARLVFLAAP